MTTDPRIAALPDLSQRRSPKEVTALKLSAEAPTETVVELAGGVPVTFTGGDCAFEWTLPVNWDDQRVVVCGTWDVASGVCEVSGSLDGDIEAYEDLMEHHEEELCSVAAKAARSLPEQEQLRLLREGLEAACVRAACDVWLAKHYRHPAVLRRAAERALTQAQIQLTAARLDGASGKLARQMAIENTWTLTAEELLSTVDGVVSSPAT